MKRLSSFTATLCALALSAAPAARAQQAPAADAPTAPPSEAPQTTEAPPTAAAPEQAAPQPEEKPATAEEMAGTSEVVDSRPPPVVRPRIAVGNESFYVKPVLQLAGGVHVENLIQTLNRARESRATTLALTRFGFEGRLGQYVSFRSEFERNIRAHGSGVWEGTASFSVRDQVIRLQRWGATLEAGIIVDPASVDFISTHIADTLLADKYTRDPLLYSGFNRGQGAQAAYDWNGFRLGFGYTAANPLSTSSSYQVGGTFGGGSRFWERPLGNFRNGQPDDDLHFQVFSPSLSYSHELFEVKAMAQVFDVNYQTSSRTDPLLRGNNLRGNVLLKLHTNIGIPVFVTPFFNIARVSNDVANSTPGFADQLLSTKYSATSLSAGVDFNLQGRSGVGVQFARIADRSPTFVAPSGDTPSSEPITRTTQFYINVGGTYWFTEDVALGARYARYQKKQDLVKDEIDNSYFITMRLML
ncbi:hypothetical protein HPC49_30655 [Pyxidicoccus fallax]|uniref:Uncharacterized protein n=1 Tax=Pyxidicoccus fallax TaxID=394095 RepID=A0A848LQC8_9BACT|nr:hypothetical protein [Pyxidicoccus fallax]NMO20097.1 hypothetical protein [Pyxidicoccus fallax]NPC82571.1 hypothetical protein [Pyxidicoccus fallax]